ncbi:MAG: sensor histidine kinase [Acutalibacter sp.]|nr:sensor histidine kinase [Acutalibacter sp.]
MKIFKGFLRDNLLTLCCIPVLAGIAVGLFYLYDLPFEPLFYTFSVLLVIGLCFAVPGFFLYRRKALKFLELRENLFSLPDIPPLPASLPESALLGALGEQRDKLSEERELSQARRQDMLEYYTLWVHQVKTPLSAIKLILQSGQGADDEALLQELFKVERYVEMVLGYLRMETMSADLRLETCSAHDIVAQAVKKFAPQFIYRKLALNFPEFQNQVLTDEKWLTFAVEQILSNALKYTKSGTISISMDERDVLTVADTGAGISPEDLPRIFERGFTGFNGRQDKTSSGLGLYLTKQILDKLNTPIEITSTPGKGTTVRLFLHRDKQLNF